MEQQYGYWQTDKIYNKRTTVILLSVFNCAHKKSDFITNRLEHHLIIYLVTDMVIYLIHTDSNHLKKKAYQFKKSNV